MALQIHFGFAAARHPIEEMHREGPGLGHDRLNRGVLLCIGGQRGGLGSPALIDAFSSQGVARS